MKNTFYFLSLLFFTNYGVAQNSEIKLNKKELKNSIKSFITSELAANKRFIIDNKILQKPTFNKNLYLVDLFNSDYFYLIQRLKVSSQKDAIKFDKIFSEDEFKSMREQIKNKKYKKWTELIGKNYKRSIDENFKNKSYYSIPVFNKDFSFATVYIEYINSGELRVFKKIKNSWILFGTSQIWSAD